MHDANTILQEACRKLPNAGARKRWMTARGLARRMRANLAGLHQDRLFEVLLSHYHDVEPADRVVRPSRLPSSKTLETLWGRVKPGEHDRGESPILRASMDEFYDRIVRSNDPDAARGASVSEATMTLWGEATVSAAADEEEDDEQVPDFFLSYSHADEGPAMHVAAMLDSRGYSTWVAGERIAPGQNVNDRIRRALDACRGFAFFLTENSVKSAWARKELIATDDGRKRFLIVDSRDDRLVEVLRALRAGAALRPDLLERLQHFQSLDADFEACLRLLAETDERVFVYAPTADGALPPGSFPRLDAFPRAGAQ